MNNKRIACIIIPEFPLELCYKKEPPLAFVPVALIDCNQPSAVVVALNKKASEAGVLINMTAAQANIVCPNLTVRTHDKNRESHKSQRIIERLQTIGPFVERGAQGTYFIEASGLKLLYKSERKLIGKVVSLIKSLGYPVKTSIANNKFVARVAAETSETGNYTIIKNGSESAFLNNLNIDCLGLSSDTREKLHNLGLKTIGRLAPFPSHEMAERFGHEGTMLSHLSRGQDTDMFVHEHPRENLSREMHLTYQIYNITVITYHIERLLKPLLDNLSRLGQSCSRIVVKLLLEDHHRETLTPSVEKPTLSVCKFTRQLRCRLEKLNLNSGVTGLVVTIPETAILFSEQLVLANELRCRQASRHNNPKRNDILSDHKLCAVTFNQSFLPERNFCLSPASPLEPVKNQSINDTETDTLLPGQTPYSSMTAFCSHPLVGLRLIQPPRETEVITENDRPSLIKTGNVCHKITRQFGPWELSGGWWRTDFDRLYYELQTKDKQMYLFFFDRLRSRWFLQGIFD